MSDQIKQLESTVTVLKSRLFDQGEELNSIKATAQTMSEALQAIVTDLGMQPDENGNVTLTDIVEAVKALIKTEEPVEEAE